MTRVIELFEDEMAKPGALSRRRFIGRFAKVSAALAAAGVGLTEFVGTAYATNYACCTLNWPNNFCNSDYMNAQCPSGCGTPYQWSCTISSGCRYVCGECDNCSCSYAYFIPCTLGCPCSPQLKAVADTYGLQEKSLTLTHRTAGERCH